MGGPSASPSCVAVMKVTARSRPAKGWPCLMKTDEAEIKCLPTLRDSFITVRPGATEHLGLEPSFNRRCLPAPQWLSAASQTHAALHLRLCFLRHSLHARIVLHTPTPSYLHTFHIQQEGITEKMERFRGTPIRSEGFGSPYGTAITAPPTLTQVGSTAIRRWISSVVGPCSHLAAHLACVLMNLFGCV